MNTGMIVSLQVGMWSGHKLDKAKTSELTDAANAEQDAARVNKHLVSKDSLKGVVKAAGALRQFFYRAALPWGDNGDRILGAAGYLDFIDAYSELKDDFMRAVDTFITVQYPAERARAQFRMGDMFVADDYPSPESLRSKFYVGLDIHGVPTGADFRVQLQDADVERVKLEIDEANVARLHAAMKVVWERVFDTITHFADRMQGDEKFRDATVRNLQDLADSIPALNLTNDPDLTALCSEIKAKLGDLNAPDLRKHPAAREQARQEALAIAKKMSGMMSGFGG